MAAGSRTTTRATSICTRRRQVAFSPSRLSSTCLAERHFSCFSIDRLSAAHLDFSSIQANKTVHSHFEGETEQIMHGRYMIVNVRLIFPRAVVVPRTVRADFTVFRHGARSRPSTGTPSESPAPTACPIGTLSSAKTAGSRRSGSRWASCTTRFTGESDHERYRLERRH